MTEWGNQADPLEYCIIREGKSEFLIITLVYNNHTKEISHVCRKYFRDKSSLNQKF